MKLGYKFTIGRAVEAPTLHLISRSRYHGDQYDESHRPWEWLAYISKGTGKTVFKDPKVATKSWKQESKEGETRGQFFTGRWQEVLKTYPRTAEDIRKLREQVKRIEASSSSSAGAIVPTEQRAQAADAMKRNA